MSEMGTGQTEPTYKEYGDVLEEARRRALRPIDPSSVPRLATLAVTRGTDWCTSVLGRSFPGIRGASTTEVFMLLVADERGLTPPLPPYIAESRRRWDERRADDAAWLAERREAEEDRWARAMEAGQVVVSVHRNLGLGRRGEVLHAAPVVDAVSDRGRHPVGRRLCEDGYERQISGPVEGASATCRGCIDLTGRIRPATEATVTAGKQHPED